MAIQLYTPSKKDRPDRLSLIGMRLEFGCQLLGLIQSIYGSYPSLAKRQRGDGVEKTIRDINQLLGMGGSFKNGCLYREEKLPELFKRGEQEQICDHAIPVAHLRDRYLANPNINIVKLALYPVVRISKEANDKLNRAGRTKSGDKEGYPLSRYEGLDISLVTHYGGAPLDPATWTDADHWALMKKTADQTPDLKEIIEHFKIELGRD
jgi:hypothetical protein